MSNDARDTFFGKHGTYTLVAPRGAQYGVLEVRATIGEKEHDELFLVADFVLRLFGDEFLPVVAGSFEQEANSRLEYSAAASQIGVSAPPVDVYDMLVQAVEDAIEEREERVDKAVSILTSSPLTSVAIPTIPQLFEVSSCKTLRGLGGKVAVMKAIGELFTGGLHTPLRVNEYVAGESPQKEKLKEAYKLSRQAAEEEAVELATPADGEQESLFNIEFLHGSRSASANTDWRPVEIFRFEEPVFATLRRGSAVLCWEDISSTAWKVEDATFGARTYLDKLIEEFAFIPLSQGTNLDDVAGLIDWDDEASTSVKGAKLEKLVSLLAGGDAAPSQKTSPKLPLCLYFGFLRHPNGNGLGLYSLCAQRVKDARLVGISLFSLPLLSHPLFWEKLADRIVNGLKRLLYAPLSTHRAIALPSDSSMPSIFAYYKDTPEMTLYEGPVTAENLRRVYMKERLDLLQSAELGYPVAVIPYYINGGIGLRSGERRLEKLGAMLGIATYYRGKIELYMGAGFRSGRLELRDSLPFSPTSVYINGEIKFPPGVRSALKKAAREAVPRWEKLLARVKRPFHSG